MTTATVTAGRHGIHLGRFWNMVSVHLESWSHLKVAPYRDGTKPVQKVISAEEQQQKSSVPAESTPRPSRRKLPEERQSITHMFSIGGHEGYITVGMYEDGTAGEIFITMAKEGSTISGLMECGSPMTRNGSCYKCGKAAALAAVAEFASSSVMVQKLDPMAGAGQSRGRWPPSAMGSSSKREDQ